MMIDVLIFYFAINIVIALCYLGKEALTFLMLGFPILIYELSEGFYRKSWLRYELAFRKAKLRKIGLFDGTEESIRIVKALITLDRKEDKQEKRFLKILKKYYDL